MNIHPYNTNCPKCEAWLLESCVRPPKPGHIRKQAPVHQVRIARAKETARLKRIIEKRQAGYLWGQKHFFTPRLLGPVFGDGGQLIAIAGINGRPAYWVARIDASWNLSNHGDPPLLLDNLEDIYQAIETEFGTGEKDDGSLYLGAKFPQACDLGMGSSWSEFTLPRKKKVSA